MPERDELCRGSRGRDRNVYRGLLAGMPGSARLGDDLLRGRRGIRLVADVPAHLHAGVERVGVCCGLRLCTAHPPLRRPDEERLRPELLTASGLGSPERVEVDLVQWT